MMTKNFFKMSEMGFAEHERTEWRQFLAPAAPFALEAPSRLVACCSLHCLALLVVWLARFGGHVNCVRTTQLVPEHKYNYGRDWQPRVPDKTCDTGQPHTTAQRAAPLLRKGPWKHISLRKATRAPTKRCLSWQWEASTSFPLPLSLPSFSSPWPLPFHVSLSSFRPASALLRSLAPSSIQASCGSDTCERGV